MGCSYKTIFVFLMPLMTLFSVVSCNEKDTVVSNSNNQSVSSSFSSSESSVDPSSSKAIFNVTFLNYDGSTLYSTSVEEGDTAIYLGETPVKPSNEEFTYEFIGWDSSLEDIRNDLTTTAQFESKPVSSWGPIHWD